ncbi:hypothetical protein D3C73_1383520 [compost metagenome]
MPFRMRSRNQRLLFFVLVRRSCSFAAPLFTRRIEQVDDIRYNRRQCNIEQSCKYIDRAAHKHQTERHQDAVKDDVCEHYCNESVSQENKAENQTDEQKLDRS